MLIVVKMDLKYTEMSGFIRMEVKTCINSLLHPRTEVLPDMKTTTIIHLKSINGLTLIQILTKQAGVLVIFYLALSTNILLKRKPLILKTKALIS